MHQSLKIPFNKPYLTGKELSYIQEAVAKGKLSGNGDFTKQCHEFFEKEYGLGKCFLTSSGTDALEMAAILLNIREGDEVIMPSFTFVSVANAFVLRGAMPVFIDSRADQPNIDEHLIEEAITPRTKAIVVVHYAGFPCEMDTIMGLASKYGLFVVEDAAHAIGSTYKERPLGSIGHLAAFSFHETKNIHSGEGGMLVVNDLQFAKRAEVIWEKGTDRAAFFRGEVNKYGWEDIGSSFLPSEITAAFLWAQIEKLEMIQKKRLGIWDDYRMHFEIDVTQTKSILSEAYLSCFPRNAEELEIKLLEFDLFRKNEKQKPLLKQSFGPSPNAHMYYLLFHDDAQREVYAKVMLMQGILCVSHYLALHQSNYYLKIKGKEKKHSLPHAERYSNTLFRLPLFYELPESL